MPIRWKLRHRRSLKLSLKWRLKATCRTWPETNGSWKSTSKQSITIQFTIIRFQSTIRPQSTTQLRCTNTRSSTRVKKEKENKFHQRRHQNGLKLCQAIKTYIVTTATHIELSLYTHIRNFVVLLFICQRLGNSFVIVIAHVITFPSCFYISYVKFFVFSFAHCIYIFYKKKTIKANQKNNFYCVNVRFSSLSMI